MELTMVTSTKMPEPIFFTTPQLAKQSVCISCTKLLLTQTENAFPKTTYTFSDHDGNVVDVVVVKQILDAEILDHVEHL